jgi:hypothetical protein
MTDIPIKVEDDEIFVEKHNAFLKNEEPDYEYIDAKLGLYQFRITSVHYKTERDARDKLQQILSDRIKIEALEKIQGSMERIIDGLDCGNMKEEVELLKHIQSILNSTLPNSNSVKGIIMEHSKEFHELMGIIKYGNETQKHFY